MAIVLVVSEEVGVREFVTEILDDAGHRVQCAASIPEAEQRRSHARPDLVLLDLLLRDSVAWLQRLIVSRPRATRLVALADQADGQASRAAERLGVSAVVERPIGLQKLLAAIHASMAAPAAHASPPAFELPLREAREWFERKYLLHHLQLAQGNVADLAHQIGLERTHLYRKLRQLGIRTAS